MPHTQQIRAILKRAAELLFPAEGTGWTKRSDARTVSGDTCDWSAETACTWCLHAAVQRAAWETTGGRAWEHYARIAIDALARTLRKGILTAEQCHEPDHIYLIVSWNDTEQRTGAEVQRALDRTLAETQATPPPG